VKYGGLVGENTNKGYANDKRPLLFYDNIIIRIPFYKHHLNYFYHLLELVLCMKNYIRILLLLICPYLFIVIINEWVRPSIKEKPYTAFGVTAMNSAERIPNQCTWECHNNTRYCMKHHVQLMKPVMPISNLFYFGMIGLLASTGNYGLANIVFLVFLIPLLILYFIYRSMRIQNDINKIKSNIV
jgi:hypothetical protein